MATKINTGDTVIDADDLIRLSDVAEITGYSRQALMKMMEGSGRGTYISLPYFICFKSAKNPEGTPMFSRIAVEQWLKDTEQHGSASHARSATRKRKSATAMPVMVDGKIVSEADPVNDPPAPKEAIVALLKQLNITADDFK